MADSKIKTKNFLSARGVPVAKLYAIIKSKKELRTFDWNTLPESFVIEAQFGLRRRRHSDLPRPQKASTGSKKTVPSWNTVFLPVTSMTFLTVVIH